MKAACMNAVPREYAHEAWHHCGWEGWVESLDVACPRCGNKGRLAPVVEIPKVEEK